MKEPKRVKKKKGQGREEERDKKRVKVDLSSNPGDYLSLIYDINIIIIYI